MARLILILGGARSGKSDFAELQAAEISPAGNVVYIATAQPSDDEMRSRIETHRAERPQQWQTIEAPTDVASALTQANVQPQVVLLDCLTILLSNLMLGPDRQAEHMPPPEEVEQRVNSELTALLDWRQSHPDVTMVVISNEVGMGLVPTYPSGRIYRDILGRANQRLAVLADNVYVLVAGIPVDWKALNRDYGPPA